MLDRVKKLNMLGPISSLVSPASTPFCPFTVIVANNSNGKSTFAQCLRSVGSGDAKPMLARAHIADDTELLPEIELQWKIDGGKSKSTRFVEGEWGGTCPFKILVFDREFVDDNVFLGDKIARENRDNLTQLVLGKESVDIAKQLETTKKEEKTTSAHAKELADTLNRIVSDLGYSVDDLLTVRFQSNLEEIQEAIGSAEAEITRVKALRENRDQILSFEPPAPIMAISYPSALLDRLNAALNASLYDIDQAVRNRIDQHVSTCISHPDLTTERWLAEGTRYLSGDSTQIPMCPFCGQELAPVKGLIDSYSTVFSEEYRKHESQVSRELDAVIEGVRETSSQVRRSLPDVDVSSLSRFGSAAQLDMTDWQSSGETILRKVRKAADEVAAALDDMTGQIDRVKNEKKSAPHNEVLSPDASQLENKWIAYSDVIAAFNDWEKRVSEFATGVQDDSRSIDIKEAFDGATNRLKALQLEERALRNSLMISDLREAREKAVSLGTSAKELRKKLQASRSTFVNRYLSIVQTHFQELGSKEFTLEPDSDFRGDRDLLGFCIRFRGKEVDHRELSNRMSESDKRALALAIFTAHFDSLPQEAKRDTIIVLDDPVVSFDQERIHHAAKIMSGFGFTARQVILLTHFEPLSRYVYEKHGLFNNTVFLRLSRKQKENSISRFDPDAEYMSDHERRLRRLRGFIERHHDEDVSRDVREFVEEELRFRYWRQVQALKPRPKNLNELIERLAESEAISDALHRKLDVYRVQLNGDVHGPVNSDTEQLRFLTQNIWDFVFNELVPSA
jgi:wobble nucleotide-excising tRNase